MSASDEPCNSDGKLERLILVLSSLARVNTTVSEYEMPLRINTVTELNEHMNFYREQLLDAKKVYQRLRLRSPAVPDQMLSAASELINQLQNKHDSLTKCSATRSRYTTEEYAELIMLRDELQAEAEQLEKYFRSK